MLSCSGGENSIVLNIEWEKDEQSLFSEKGVKMRIVQVKSLRDLTVVALLMPALTLVACGTAPASPTSTDRFPAEVEAQMAQIVKDQMTQSLMPGVIAGVWIPGRGTWIHAVGVADLESGELMDPTMHFRIASNTKTFTANHILQLADEDELELEDPKSKWIPDFPTDPLSRFGNC